MVIIVATIKNDNMDDSDTIYRFDDYDKNDNASIA